ncbi:MAG: hypothetical protein WBH86_02200 [Thermogutta sp.]
MRASQAAMLANVVRDVFYWACFSIFMTSVISQVGVSLASEPGIGQIETLPGTEPLDWSGDIASRMIDAIDAFLLRQTEHTAKLRQQAWASVFSPDQWPSDWLQAKRERLAQILGVKDPRVSPVQMTILSPPGQSRPLAEGAGYDVYAVSWDVFTDLKAEGILLYPKHDQPKACVLAIPDADVSPEALIGLELGVPPASQYARRLAESGCVVVIPSLISREISKRGNVSLTHREFIYRPAYELGRHIIGYELAKILAAIDYFDSAFPTLGGNFGVIGWGEGGMLALYAGALDARLGVVGVSGYFGPREHLWQAPVDRNVFGLLKDFSDAEISLLIYPRSCVIEAARGPEVTIPPKLGGAPGELKIPSLEEVKNEFDRANRILQQAGKSFHLSLVPSENGSGPYGTEPFLRAFLASFGTPITLSAEADPPRRIRDDPWRATRTERAIAELDRHIQRLLVESPEIRKRFWAKLDTSSLERFSQSVEWYRKYFYDEIIGRFDIPLADAKPRTRKVYDTLSWEGFEVVLSVFDEVFAYGILLIPKGIKPGERRPVVVCQHGLEGRPQETIEGDHRAYHNFAARLADEGFVVFAPQNPYIFGDRFRTLQRKANPLGKTLFSIIVPQHQQIVNWLSTLEFVDPGRIAFYGLSYGGKTAMRVPPLVPQYCAVICSADFNEWVWKNASTKSRYSYVWTGEYEIFEFALGETFNYAEMATLIAPRPFMVERGHFDGVAPDETVAYEYAKVRFLYNALLKIGDRTEIEWFAGPHEIHGVGTFQFLHKNLRF